LGFAGVQQRVFFPLSQLKRLYNLSVDVGAADSAVLALPATAHREDAATRLKGFHDHQVAFLRDHLAFNLQFSLHGASPQFLPL
jgi:hypothetical protein